MKKVILIVMTILIATSMVLTGCGDSSASGSRGNSGTKVLTYLASSVTDEQGQKVKELIDAFNLEIADEGYEIEMSSPGGDYYTSLGNMFAAQDPPDIFLMDGGNFSAYSKYNYLEPLDTYLSESTEISADDLWDINSYYQYDKTAGVGSGSLYGIIKDWSPDFMMLYNKTMLDSYNTANPNNQFIVSATEPMTWTEFYEMTSTIQKSMGVTYGTSIGFEPYKHLMEWVQMTGSSLFTDDNTTLNINDEGVRDAFEFFCALQKDNETEFDNYVSQNGTTAPASYTTAASTAEQESFKQGKAFSIFSGLWSFYTYDFYDTGFEVGVTVPPVPDDSSDTVYAGCSGMIAHCVSSSSSYKDIAFRFLEYYMTDGQEEMAKIGFNIPGNKTIASSDAFLNPEDSTVKELNNYFYDLALSGTVHPIEYNPNIGFTKMSTHFQSQFAKYFSGDLSFDNLLIALKEQLAQEIV